MNFIKRACLLPARGFSSWSNLGAFVGPHSQGAWQSLRRSEQKVAAAVKENEDRKERAREIDWDAWERQIAHKDIVKCMRAYYEQQQRVLSSVLDSSSGSSSSRVKDLTVGWSLFDAAVKNCEEAVKQSETLLTDGASALWVSYHNPCVSKLDTNEWLDTDQYWQAFVEKHFFYSPYQPGVEDPESPAEKERVKASFHLRMAKFNDRSDTPVLYNFMESLPSWEYYDIHRRAFLEHMIYFLLRRGTDYRFFPEVFPWQWIGDIEDHRYKYFAVAQRRRSQHQLSSLSREEALDLLPLDIEHSGAEEVLKFLTREAETVRLSVSRLMANFAFLCDPFVPCSSLRAAVYAMKRDKGEGRWFDLGEDVNCLFYLPKTENRTIPRPKEAFFSIMDHLQMTGRRMNPSYATVFDCMTDILEQRGENWFCADGECASQAFLRRLRDDDPMREVFCDYFAEMYSRFTEAKEVKVDEFISKMKEKEEKYRSDAEVYALASVATCPDTAAAAKEHADHLSHLLKSKELQPIMDNNGVVALDANGNKVEDAGRLIASFQEFEKMKEIFLESLKTVKTPAASSKA